MPILKLPTLALVLFAAALSGCDQLGIETPDKVAARQEADGKAVGGACRHAGRALEDCYIENKKASKAAIYAGWRDMDGYMRENNIAEVKPDDDAPETAKNEESTKENAKEATKQSTKAASGESPAAHGEDTASQGKHEAVPGKGHTKTS